MNEMASNGNLDLASQVNDRIELASSLFELYPEVYVQDTNVINGGYPVFAWQITA
jgi:hypothetical protein